MTTAIFRTAPGRAMRLIVSIGVGLTLGLTSCAQTPSVVPDASGTAPDASDTAPSSTSSPSTSSPSSEPRPASTAGQTAGQAGDGAGPPSSPGRGQGSAAEDAAGIARAVDAELTTLAEGGDPVTRDRVRAAIEQGFANEGAVPASVEVSVDSTPTGLDVDSIQGAGRLEQTCVVGEVREGTATVVVLPALASGLCFVGDQR
ncbi:DUF6993 domain-containing protein [Arthrobacter pityocampae]|uniref:DUF6993 domain-containing protein n=1 Tax=Arthrobacter pityocampae TaxID=547334 RepID=UPI003735B0E3